MTTLYLVRHGETEDNVNKIMQGQTQGQLTENGREQARVLSLQMQDEEIDAFLSSDLRRSIETCEIIARPHRLPVVSTPLLRERDWGSFTGRYIPDLQNVPWTDDIETMGEMRERASHFLQFVRREYPDKKVLAVGHGIINKVIQSVFFRKPVHEVEKMMNCEVRILIL